ncbi:acyl-CoA N-acyltransferase [Phlegmacium glaucopus]|nr:acyl-CoA N-acyltransferase [Phlegmacium glaucopus]
MTPQHEIILVDTAEQRQECYDVRIAVFHLEQNFPLETEIDEPVIPFLKFYNMEDNATHFLLRLMPSLTPIGTIRACEIPGAGYYKLTRLAVLKDYRKYKFGRALVLRLHEWVRRHALQVGALGPVKIICHSQLPVTGFYAKFGYEAEGDEFDEDGDPHQKMVLQLPLGPSPRHDV